MTTMRRAYAPSICTEQCRAAMARTNATNATNEEAWLSSRDRLTFRNARAHIRKFPSADFGGKR